VRHEDRGLSRALQDILMHHWLFGILPGRVLVDLSNQFVIKSYNRGQYVFHQDDPADRLYVVIDGEVAIQSLNLDGDATHMTQLRDGEIFGEFALIDASGRSASAVIERPSTLASLSQSTFHQLLDDYPEFSKKLLEVLVTRLRRSNDQVESLVTFNVRQRLARLLLLSTLTDGDVLKLTQQQIADRIHATREKVNTQIKWLEARGALTTGHAQLTILDRALLTQTIEAEFD